MMGVGKTIVHIKLFVINRLNNFSCFFFFTKEKSINNQNIMKCVS